jgi:hypothetical protein
MNTPAHAIVNLLLLGRKKAWRTQLIIIIGAVIPDIPIVIFYIYKKLIQSMPEHHIWTEAYYQKGWQIFIDLFNSIPLLSIALLLTYLRRMKLSMLLLLSMLLHILGDMPLHHDDAHRHFFPFSDWRFHSPFSYWDPDYYGLPIGLSEITLFIVGAILLLWHNKVSISRGMIKTIALSYVGYLIFVVMVWL